MSTDGMYDLIAAIINLAKKDYRRALRHDFANSEYNSKEALERFFYGDWLQFLTMGRADPDALIAQAKAGDYRRQL